MAFLWLIIAVVPAAAADDVLERGEYLFRAAGCATCHTDEKHHGAPLAGGRALKTNLGIFYTPNITPDPETGIGSWSEADFRRALREGRDDEGEFLYPVFPYTSYTHLTDDDIHAIRIFLFSQKPVQQVNREHILPWYLRYRPLIRFWQMWYFRPGTFQPQPGRSAEWNRGAYLTTAVTHCGECHTPRNFLGGYNESLRYAGNPEGVDGDAVPNITPDKKTGIGKWSQGDLVEYLDTGATPDGDYAGGAMAEEIDNSTSHLTRGDREAIAEYVMSQPAVETVKYVHKKKKPKSKKSGFE
jgi:mono/diheme cytochrome c family protein